MQMSIDSGRPAEGPRMNPMPRPKPPMKFAKLALIATATAAAIIAFPATASAGVGPTFKSPSGNIACWVADDMAGCQVIDHTYASWPGGCSSPAIAEFTLVQGKAVDLHCGGNPGNPPATWPADTLDYGKTYSVGVMSCDSETSGVTCTDTSTGRFFRVSQESYQLG
jgi:hypothetical protein